MKRAEERHLTVYQVGSNPPLCYFSFNWKQAVWELLNYAWQQLCRCWAETSQRKLMAHISPEHHVKGFILPGQGIWLRVSLVWGSNLTCSSVKVRLQQLCWAAQEAAAAFQCNGNKNANLQQWRRSQSAHWDCLLVLQLNEVGTPEWVTPSLGFIQTTGYQVRWFSTLKSQIISPWLTMNNVRSSSEDLCY